MRHITKKLRCNAKKSVSNHQNIAATIDTRQLYINIGHTKKRHEGRYRRNNEPVGLSNESKSLPLGVADDPTVVGVGPFLSATIIQLVGAVDARCAATTTSLSLHDARQS